MGRPRKHQEEPTDRERVMEGILPAGKYDVEEEAAQLDSVREWVRDERSMEGEE